MLYFGIFHMQIRKNSAAEHNYDSLLINCLWGLCYLKKLFSAKRKAAVLFLKCRAHTGPLLLLPGARGKRIANVTWKSSVNSNCKLKGDFVSFLYGKCMHVISAWQCTSECMVWTITNNDSGRPHQKAWNKEMTMIDGSWLFTDFSRRVFLGVATELGNAVPCLSFVQQGTSSPVPAALRHTVGHLPGKQLHFFLVSLPTAVKYVWLGEDGVSRGRLSRGILKLPWQNTQRGKHEHLFLYWLPLILWKTVALSKNHITTEIILSIIWSQNSVL